MLMWKKSNLNRKKGMTILETVMYLSISAIIIFSTLIVMTSMVKKADAENKTSFRVNKLYSTMNTIEKYVNAGSARDVHFSGGLLCFNNKSNSKYCSIKREGGVLKFNIGGAISYFMRNEYYSTEVKSFDCNIKGNLLYINIKLKTGEMMKKCIHVNQ